ncbi:hypothetical protein QQS21_003961 [Conoideocrella luteorostrata]|uniref:DUF7707 domain-containing protein n=1 Tax=Conoideocrella luteorostrata TaxID=1105319 RepID=A0AAJ0G061_9HYPO|nr:hypothetical protein QQS21_003961 [Conoideocrella luteorostrata]
MRSSAAFVALAIASVQAQTTNKNYTSELDMTIDPNSVAPTLRATWCQGQTNTCGLLCNNAADSNICTEADLKWNCTCSSNSSMPGIQYYKQTMPFYICTKLHEQCITANVGNQRGQESCNKDILALCATNDPPKGPVKDSGDASTTSSASAPTGSSDSGRNGPVTSTTSHAFAGPTLAPVGSGAFVAAMGMMAYML